MGAKVDAQKYVVYSDGQVKPGYDAEQVAKHLSEHFKQEPEVIQRELMSGRRRKIKSSDSYRKAQRVARLASNVGLDVIVEVETLLESTIEAANQGRYSSQTKDRYHASSNNYRIDVKRAATNATSIEEDAPVIVEVTHWTMIAERALEIGVTLIRYAAAFIFGYLTAKYSSS